MGKLNPVVFVYIELGRNVTPSGVEIGKLVDACAKVFHSGDQGAGKSTLLCILGY